MFRRSLLWLVAAGLMLFVLFLLSSDFDWKHLGDMDAASGFGARSGSWQAASASTSWSLRTGLHRDRVRGSGALGSVDGAIRAGGFHRRTNGQTGRVEAFGRGRANPGRAASGRAPVGPDLGASGRQAARQGAGRGSGFKTEAGSQEDDLRRSLPHPGPDAVVQDYLRAELAVLGLIGETEKEIKGTVSELWAARGLRHHALEIIDVGRVRVKAQRKRIERRRAEIARWYRALYKLVDGWQSVPLMDHRRAQVPGDGRVEMALLIAHRMKELQSEKLVLADLEKRQNDTKATLRQAITREAQLDAMRDHLQARLALLNQEFRDLLRRKEHRHRSREVWDATARRLARAVADLQEKVRDEGRSFEERKGLLARPVPGIVIRPRMDRRLARAGRRSHGVLIGAERGWKARAPAAGTVRFTGPVPGFGHVVMIDHGEGFLSVVGYLARIEVRIGQRIRRGAVLGAVRGRPGRDRKEPLTCYYELRRGAVPLDPVQWFHGGRHRGIEIQRPKVPGVIPQELFSVASAAK
ncbi:MAG: peptidoglycan DD-metalloendopeptidase family protein [Deltaproteobacteria bacterium]|nr:peptidoglycan DD-metalloendopeptidase family protein [Deltaproteobacteria bacterium]